MSRREHGTRSERQEHGAWEQHTGQRRPAASETSAVQPQSAPAAAAAPSSPQQAQRSPPAGSAQPPSGHNDAHLLDGHARQARHVHAAQHVHGVLVHLWRKERQSV